MDCLTLVWFFVGLVLVAAGAELLVDGASSVARRSGVSEFLIGMTIVGFGTSLPELATCLVAARRRDDQLAIGNILGSNIFNILFILGVSALVTPLPMGHFSMLDAMFLLISPLLLMAFCFMGTQRMERWQGAIMLCSFGIYMALLFLVPA